MNILPSIMILYQFKIKFIVLVTDIKVKITIKNYPTTLPVNLNANYDVFAIDINKEYLK